MIYCLSGLDFTYSLARLIFHADINETLPDKTHFWTESGVLRNSQKGDHNVIYYLHIYFIICIVC